MFMFNIICVILILLCFILLFYLYKDLTKKIGFDTFYIISVKFNNYSSNFYTYFISVENSLKLRKGVRVLVPVYNKKLNKLEYKIAYFQEFQTEDSLIPDIDYKWVKKVLKN